MGKTLSGDYQPIDVARNARIVEWLKAELAASLAGTYRAMWRGRTDAVTESLASVVMLSYLLASRLGVNYSQLDNQLLGTLRTNIEDDHQLEQWYGDLSALVDHWHDRHGEVS